MTVSQDKLGYDDPKSPDEIIREAKAFYAEDFGYEKDIREMQKFDLRFSLGLNHWENEVYQTRVTESRPMLVIPRMNEFLNKVKNEQRQNKPSIKVSPAGAKSEEIQRRRIRAAKNRQGLIRHIQYDSKAMEAYQTAFDFAIDIGRGFFRIRTEYVSPDSFDQKIMIDRIPNPFNVVFDRNREEIDYSDAKRAFIADRMTRERFKTEFPDADPANWSGLPSHSDDWMTQDDLYVMEYYTVRQRKRKLLGLDDGETIYEDQLTDFEREEKQEIYARVIKEREIKQPYVKWYRMTSIEVLEEKDILGRYIPIVPVVAVEKSAAGKLVIKGMARDLRDTQILYNFWASTEAELLTLSPKTPYIAAKGQIEGYKKYWESANRRAWAYLAYDPVTSGGRPVPAPQRVPFAGVPIGIVNAKAGTVEDMRAITGQHEVSLGMPGQEKSGRAILAQQRIGDRATFHYIDNMGIALNHAGRIINEWLPNVYDTNRIERILGEDNEEDTIEIGGTDENGDEIELGTGEFDVVVSMGPSYTTKRQEAAESMLSFMQAVHNVVPLIYDLMVKNMDWPGAQEIAERLRKTIPPQILEQQGGEQQMAQTIQQLTAQVQQYEGLVPQLAQQLEAAMKQLEDEGAEIAKDMEIQRLKSATDITVANIKANTEREKNFQTVLQQVRTPSNGAPGG